MSAPPSPVDAAAPDVRGVDIRLIAPEQLDVAAEVLLAAYGHDFELSEDYRAGLADPGRWAREHQVWVATTGGADADPRLDLLGLVVTPRPGGPSLSPLAGPGELDFRLLAVHPAARGRGVGEALTRHVLALAGTRGAARVVMNSGPDMVAAHRLYLRLGFSRLPEREDRLVPGPHGPIRLLAFGLDL